MEGPAPSGAQPAAGVPLLNGKAVRRSAARAQQLLPNTLFSGDGRQCQAHSSTRSGRVCVQRPLRRQSWMLVCAAEAAGDVAAAVGSKRSTSPLARQEAAISTRQPPVSSISSKRLKMSRVPEPEQGTTAAADGMQAAKRALELVKGLPEEGYAAQLPPDGANKTPAKQHVAGEPLESAALRADMKSTFLWCNQMCANGLLSVLQAATEAALLERGLCCPSHRRRLQCGITRGVLWLHNHDSASAS